MKSIAYYALHYGKEYLAWSIRSIQDAVDEIHILYTDRPSFGFHTKLRCPDTEQELKDQANKFINKPLIWHKGNWAQEGAHRDSIYKIAADVGADRVLVVDADEIWNPEDAKRVVETAHESAERSVLVPFTHFWRSFKWSCTDGAMPVRILNVNKPIGTTGYVKHQELPVLHFGYAQSEVITKYKESIHGHRSEWRRNWYKEKFEQWHPGIEDVHPTCYDNFWNPKEPELKIKEVIEKTLFDHPYKDLDIIR